MSFMPLLESKLTKKFFMQLDGGNYIVSNAYVNSSKSSFEEVISPLSEREKQWRRIVSASADQRLCRVFKSKENHLKWLSQVHNIQPVKNESTH